jgi:hypothetical protein
MGRFAKAALVCALLGGLLALPIRAGADRAEVDKRGPKSCPDGAYCVWTGKHYEGTRVKLTTVGEVINLPASVNNKVSSAKNRYELTAYLYKRKNGLGKSFCLDPGGNIPDFSAFTVPFNNVASSALLPDEPPPNCV